MFQIAPFDSTYKLMSAVPDLTSLGPYPLIQIFGTLAVFGLSFLFWILGRATHTDKAPTAEVYLDGPLVAAARELGRMAKAIEDATASVKRVDEVEEELSRKMGEFRKEIYGRAETNRSDMESELREFRERIHKVELDIARGTRRG